jgi:hypothetical protein
MDHLLLNLSVYETRMIGHALGNLTTEATPQRFPPHFILHPSALILSHGNRCRLCVCAEFPTTLEFEPISPFIEKVIHNHFSWRTRS